jgi:hypothetical protein
MPYFKVLHHLLGGTGRPAAWSRYLQFRAARQGKIRVLIIVGIYVADINILVA